MDNPKLRVTDEGPSWGLLFPKFKDGEVVSAQGIWWEGIDEVIHRIELATLFDPRTSQWIMKGLDFSALVKMPEEVRSAYLALINRAP